MPQSSSLYRVPPPLLCLMSLALVICLLHTPSKVSHAAFCQESATSSVPTAGPLAGPVFAHWEDLPGFEALTNSDARNRAIQTRAFRTLLERYNTVLWQLDLTPAQEADFKERIETFRQETTQFSREHGREVRALQQTTGKDAAEREHGELRSADGRLVELDRTRPHPEKLIASIWDDLTLDQQIKLRALYDAEATESATMQNDRPMMTTGSLETDQYDERTAENSLGIDEESLSRSEKRELERLHKRAEYLERISAQDGGLPAPKISDIIFDFEKPASQTTGREG